MIAYCGKVLRTKKTHIALSVLAVLITTAIVVILELADLLGMKSADVCTATVCATAVIFEVAAFLFGCSALSAETK